MTVAQTCLRLATSWRCGKPTSKKKVILAVTAALLAGPSVTGASDKVSPSPIRNSIPASEQSSENLTEQRVCHSGHKLDPFETWKGVTRPKDAVRLLRSNYRRIGSIEGMADWLRCQGFVVGFLPGPSSQVKDSQQKIDVGFILREHGGKRLWRGWIPWLPIYAHTFELYFDDAQKLLEIRVGQTNE